MTAAADSFPASEPHIPVLLRPLIEACAPIAGHWIDGTLGAGGYTRGLFGAGAEKVTGVDRDPIAHTLAGDWGRQFAGRLSLWMGTFSQLDQSVSDLVDGVVLDLKQIDPTG